MTNWGVHKHGAVLHIDEPYSFDYNKSVIFDFETTDKDIQKAKFVGMGWTQDGHSIFYTTNLETVKDILSCKKLIAHNLKFDSLCAKKFGVNVVPEDLKEDTILMSYVMNTTKESHSLKVLGKELGYEWPTYSEMVGKGRTKKTLDKQTVEEVAAYCGMDVLVTFRLYQVLKRKMDLNASRIYSQIELPLMRILFEMEVQGVLIDVKKLENLDTEFTSKLNSLRDNLCKIAGKEINPNSNKQVAEVITNIGLELPKTPKGNLKVDKWALEKYQDYDFVKMLMEYNKIEKLVSTYTRGLLKRETLPKVYTTYNQVVVTQNDEKGISTGRLSSANPNLQQIPTRTEEGKLIREAFIPKYGHTLIDADYSQIEPRLVAHFSKDPFLTKVFKTGVDLYDSLVEGTGRDRSDGKTFMLALLYGAQPKKLARNFKCSEEEAEIIINRIMKKIPGVTAWINRVKYEAQKKKGIFTLMKGWRALPEIVSDNKFERFHWERCSVNYLIQGSAAEILKMATIQLRVSDYLPLLTVHDELLFEVDPSSYYGNGVTHAQQEIKDIMESVVTLDVPLIAEIGAGSNWKEAKGD